MEININNYKELKGNYFCFSNKYNNEKWYIYVEETSIMKEDSFWIDIFGNIYCVSNTEHSDFVRHLNRDESESFYLDLYEIYKITRENYEKAIETAINML